jgi:hypothetical protein
MNRPLALSLAICALAAIETIAFMFVAHNDSRPHKDVFDTPLNAIDVAGWILFSIAPYFGVAVLAFAVRRRERASRAALISTVVIAMPGLILVSPLVYEPPQPGLIDMSWNGRVPFVLVALGQWVLFVPAALVVGLVWIRSRSHEKSLVDAP